MHLFFDLCLAYSSLALFVLPLIACRWVDCSTYDDTLSISAIIHKEPLATTYAYFGAIFLLVVLFYQTIEHSLVRYFLSFMAVKCASVPLIMPLASVREGGDMAHDSLAILGAVFECAYGVSVCTDLYSSAKPPRYSKYVLGSTIVMFITILLGLFTYIISQVSLDSQTKTWTSFQTYSMIVLEYTFGVSILVMAKSVEMIEMGHRK